MHIKIIHPKLRDLCDTSVHSVVNEKRACEQPILKRSRFFATYPLQNYFHKFANAVYLPNLFHFFNSFAERLRPECARLLRKQPEHVQQRKYTTSSGRNK